MQLILLLQIAYLLADYFIYRPSAGMLAPHVFNLAAVAAFLFIMPRPLFSRHWRGLVLGLCVAIMASLLAGSLAERRTDPHFVTVVLIIMMGAGALVPWNNRWQFALTSTVLAVMAVAPKQANVVNEWVDLLAGAGVGHFATILAQRYRQELKARLAATDDNHRELLRQVTQREAAIAERERAQQQLRESEATLRKVFDTSLNSIAINRLRSGEFIVANREFVSTFGYGIDEVIGRSSAELRLWARPEEHRAFVKQLESQGFVRNMEAELRRKDGRVLPAQISAALAEVEGEPCVISVTRDITLAKTVEAEMIAAREAAEAASEAKSEFVSSVSHEIRTPMNAILGTADLLEETALSFEQRHFVETIRANGNAMLTLVNGVLDLARVESGRLALERVEFDLRDLVEKTLEALATSAHEKKLELATRIKPGVPLALIGDPMRLRQILVNLLGNAIKFTERGEIIVTVEALPKPAPLDGAGRDEGQGWFRIMVADTGVGIAADRRDAIFAGFAQATSSTARKYGSSGLGLSITKRLVELMNGRIELESEVGKGSTFSVVVPFELRTAPIIAEGAETKDETLRGKRVLIADDTLANRVIAGEWLAERGAEVVDAVDGAQALAKVQQARLASHPYDVLLIDARMPELDGITVAQRLLGDRNGENAARCEATVLMLTSDELTPALARMREIGLDSNPRCGYVVKPLKRSDLLNTITRVLSPIRSVEREQSERSQPPAVEAAAPVRPLRILLADDSIDNRLLIKAFLKQHPYTLEFAENGQEAFDQAIAAPFDLVLMDIQMPIVDGYTAVRKIREWERSHGRVPVPMIALTASALDEAVRKSLEAGCDAHLAKPVRKATLIEAILKATALPGGSGRAAAPAEPEQ